MRNEYRRWLEAEKYSGNTVNTQYSHAGRLEQAYGDLDEHYERDRLAGLSESLRYSSLDGRRGRPNPSKIPISGDIYKSLASFRSAIGLYRRFRDESGEDARQGIISAELGGETRRREPDEIRERIGLERDLQKALRRDLDQLEPKLKVADEGVERAVPSGYIDITACDSTGAIVVIELKAGVADRSAVGQILSYMGDVAEEEDNRVRGILVAHDFDGKARAAARMVPNLDLRTYAVRFTFQNPT